MGLCTSRSTVSLDPSARVLSHMEEQNSEAGTPTSDEKLSVVQGTKPAWDEKLFMVQGTKPAWDEKLSVAKGTKPAWDEKLSVAKGTRVTEVSGFRSGGSNPQAKGYLELASKGETEPQTSREAEEEEEEDTDGDLEELLNFSDSDGSLTELLELNSLGEV